MILKADPADSRASGQRAAGAKVVRVDGLAVRRHDEFVVEVRDLHLVPFARRLREDAMRLHTGNNPAGIVVAQIFPIPVRVRVVNLDFDSLLDGIVDITDANSLGGRYPRELCGPWSLHFARWGRSVLWLPAGCRTVRWKTTPGFWSTFSQKTVPLTIRNRQHFKLKCSRPHHFEKIRTPTEDFGHSTVGDRFSQRSQRDGIPVRQRIRSGNRKRTAHHDECDWRKRNCERP